MSVFVATSAGNAADAVPREARVRTTGVLRVCIWPGYYAISFRNPRNGLLEGIDIDLSRALAESLGARVEHVMSGFGSFVDDLAGDRCDVAMFGIGVTAARAERVDFSTAYLRSGIYAVAATTNRRIRTWADIDRLGVVVAVQAGTFMEPVMRDYLKQATISIVRSPQTREDEVLSGRADVFATDYPYSRRMLFQHEWARVIEPPEPIAPTPYAYAVARGQPDWLAVIDRFVETV
ncbi:MAG: ABC transporter substrate-binding protein, partial [Alphaproteobacteria bacterium]